MRKKQLFRVGAPVVVLLALLGLTISAAAQDESDPRGRTTVLRLAGTPSRIEPIDLGAPGPSPGDQILFTNDFHTGGQRTGYDGGMCTTVRVDPERVINCFITLSLPDGLITAQVMKPETDPPSPTPFWAAVTGGTGEYRDARGQIHVDPSDPSVPPTHYFTVYLENRD